MEEQNPTPDVETNENEDRPAPQPVIEGQAAVTTEPAASQPASETPAPTEETPEEDDDLYGFNQLPAEAPAIPGLDVSRMPRDEYGNVDATAFVQALAAQQQQVLQAATAQARQEVLETLQEQKLWEKAMGKYPELKENKKLRDLVHKQRAGSILAGQKATPIQAAEAIFEHIKTAKEQGKVEATVSERTQASAHLETSDVQSDGDPNRTRELYGKIDSHNREEAAHARQAILMDMLKKGDIQLP